MHGVDGRLPPDAVIRTDPSGRSISLHHTAPRSQAVLFTGAPGMGKSTELARTQAHAREQGWTVLRADASPREPLESRFIRAVDDQLDALRRQHGYWAVRKLKKTLRDLAPRRNDIQNGAELRFGMMPVQAVVKRQWAAPNTQGPGATLNELADRLGELSARQGKPAIIMIDNVDVASDRDLAAVNELAAHLKSNGQVFLVAAGGEQATTRLMNASRGLSGVETDIGRRYDLRECRPLTDDELRPVLAAGLGRQGVAADPAALEALVESANGSPQRLEALTEHAVRLAQSQPSSALSADGAARTIATVDAQSRLYYEASWNNSGSEEKNLLAQTAVRGERGLSLPAFTQAAGIDKFPKIDAARQSLKARGLLRESESGRVKFGDPGLQAWVRDHVGDSVPHRGVPLQATLGKAAVDSQPGAAQLSQSAHSNNPHQADQSNQGAQLNQGTQSNQGAQLNQGARARVPAAVDRRGGGYQR